MNQNAPLDIKPSWRNGIKRVWTAEEGSVCFVEFLDDKVYVVKGSSRVVQETYAACVLVSAGIPCAAIRVVNSKDSEWSEIKSSLRSYTTRNTVEETEKVKIKNLLGGPLDRAQIMVIEYVEGTSFDMLYGAKLKAFLANEETLVKNCRTCGQILAVDLFLQNSDRIPTVVWQNDGNGGNLMVNASNQIFAIDSLITTVDPMKEKSKKYFERKEENILEFFKELGNLYESKDIKELKESLIIQKFEKFFHTYTRNKVENICLLAFVEGIVEGCWRVALLIKANYFQELYQYMSEMFKVTWNNGWEKDLQLVHLKFLEKMAPHFLSFVEKFEKDFGNVKVSSYFPVRPTKKMNIKHMKKVSLSKKPAVNITPKGFLSDIAGFKKKGKEVGQPALSKPKLLFSPSDLSGLKTGLKKGTKKAEKGKKAALEKPKVAAPNKMALLQKETEKNNQFEAQCMKLFVESSSKMYTMHRESTIENALNRFELMDSDIIFFDFDQTLTMPQKIKIMGVKAKLRGGASTKAVLNSLHEAKKSLFVLTANPPTAIAAASVMGEIRHLGLDHVFHCKPANVQEIEDRITAMGIGKDINLLTKQLIILLSLHSSRTGDDLYRISADNVEINKPMVSFKLFQENKETGELTYTQLSTTQLVESTLLCEVLENYQALTQSEIKFRCLLVEKKANGYTQLAKHQVLRGLKATADELRLSERVVQQLSYGEAIEYKTSEVKNVTESIKNIKLASAGNVICSKYNKAEAIQFVLSLLQNHNNDSRVNFQFERLNELRAKKKLKVTFIDDNASNVFSVFQYFAQRKDVSVNSVWYTPPLVGSNELQKDDPLENIVSKVSLLSLRHLKSCSRDMTIPKPPLNVLLIQEGPMSIVLAAKKMKLLVEAKRAQNEPVSCVIFPEGFIIDNIVVSKADAMLNKAFLPLVECAKLLKVSVIAGTFREVGKDKKFYTSSIFISSTGEILAKYRKQKVHNFEYQAYGNENAVFDTELGRVAILICLDIEDETLLKSVIAEGAKIIFNPIHIPLGKTIKGQENQSWRYKLQSMAKYLEKVCADSGVTVIRCDMPYPHGCGTTQVITPTFTETISTRSVATLTFDLNQPPLDELFNLTPSSSYERTDNKDNNGLRVTAQNFRLNNLRPTMLRYNFTKNKKQSFFQPELLLYQEKEVSNLNVRSLSVARSVELKNMFLFDPPFNANIFRLKENVLLFLLEGCLAVGDYTADNDILVRGKIKLSFPIENFTINTERDTIYCLGSGHVSIISLTHNRVVAPIRDFIK